MLEKIKGNIETSRDGFSLAEMLIVLLIISFLVLAMPPIVHKKVQKRITRGEHGRYECWIDPTDNETYEYYATEKNGPCSDCGTKNDPKGYKPTGGQCTFKPKEMAPNAAYFSFNVIGGGAGGSYAPYDPSNKMYKDPSSMVSAEVRLGNRRCISGPKTDGSCSVNTSDLVYSEFYPTGSGSCQRINPRLREPIDGSISSYEYGGGSRKVTYNEYNYKNSIDAWDKLPATADWVKHYWIPVSLTDTSLIFCSGSGYNGAPKLQHVVNHGSDGALATEYYSYFYGGPGGKGVCVSLKPEGALPTGKTYPSLGTDNYFKVIKPERENHGAYFYVEDNDSTSNIKPTKLVSIEKEWVSRNFAASNSPVTNPDPKILVSVAPSCGAPNYACNNSYEGNYVYLEDTAGTTKLLVYPGENGHEGDYRVPTERSQAGEVVTVGDETINFTGQNAADREEFKNSVDAEDSIWRVVSTKEDFAASVPSSGQLFPSNIYMERFTGYDSTTFGYPGEPGESISMFLPSLAGNLTFDIGQGGSKGSSSSKTGASGGSTYVKNSDGVTIFTAKGGIGHMGGEIGAKVLMFGEDTLKGRGEESSNPLKLTSVCESGVTFGSKTDTDGNKLLIDGCLDKGVRDNEKRFSADSGFYTILELDTNTKTPSVINKLYGSIDDGGSGMLPGSGGDGGYSFLRDTRGEEQIKYYNHPQKRSPNWTKYEYNYTYTDATGTTHSNIEQNYKCYRKKEAIGEASGDAVGTSATVCEPSRGYPGAVVIVW